MCDVVLSFARDQLLPIARDHLLPLLKEVTNMIRGVPTEVADMKNELESIEDFINDADRMTEAEEDNTHYGIKAKIKQLREASFRIQDVIDECIIFDNEEVFGHFNCRVWITVSHDLRYNLKQCFLYFGIYPGNYEVNTMRLIKQWVAEGFSKVESGKTVEDVAEQYLTELIHRILVDVTSFSRNSKARSCRVHGLTREMILDKIQDLSFCHFACDNEEQSVLSLMTRRLTISTSSNTLLSRNVECSNIRSLHVFRNEELPDSFVASIPSKYKLLKVFDFEDVALHHYVPKDLGDLFHLRYLSFRNTKVRNLPGSIGKLHNLETLDLRQNMVREIPKEINQLQKLRHLLAYDMSKAVGYGIQINDGIGDIGSLQTLREVQADHGGVKMITDLQRLKVLKMLGLTNVKKEYTEAICFKT